MEGEAQVEAKPSYFYFFLSTRSGTSPARPLPTSVALFFSMSGTPLNRSPPRDDFSLLAPGGGGNGRQGTSDDDIDETIVDAIGGEVFNVVVPVAACIAVTSALVQVLNPSGANGSAGVSWASAAYKEKVKRKSFFPIILIDPHAHLPMPLLDLIKPEKKKKKKKKKKKLDTS